MATQNTTHLLQELQNYTAPQLRRLLVEHLTKQKLGLYWESSAIQRDEALNANVVLPRLLPDVSHTPPGTPHHRNLIIEGDNFDSLRLLRATHAGNKDWVNFHCTSSRLGDTTYGGVTMSCTCQVIKLH